MGSSALLLRPELPMRRPDPTSPPMERLTRAIAIFLGIASLVLGTVGATVELTGNVLPWVLGSSARPTATLPVMAPDPQWASFTNQHLAPDAMFKASYAAHGGSAVLGPALTPALPLSGGWIQFYRAGALYVPGSTPASTQSHSTAAPADSGSANSALRLLIAKYSDPTGGVALLPVLQVLLAAGSEVGIGDPSANLTYVDLRRAAQPDQQIRAPGWYGPGEPTGPTGTFIAEGKRDGAVVGHLIPPDVTVALNQANVSPDGWRVDFGNPLTEALTGTALPGGHVQQFTVQVFERGALVLKASPQDASGRNAAPPPQPLSIGLDYLETFGPPTVSVVWGTPIWGTDETALYQMVGRSALVAHVGPRFSMIVSDELARWQGGRLWYHASWQEGASNGSGWIPADSVSFAAPADGPVWEGFEMLDPGLAAYLAGLSYHVGALVYDVSHQRYYFYNDRSPFIVASSVKVPIMLSLLTQIERQGRQPTSDEMYLLTTMIENSNNASAQALYEEIGDAQGLTSYMQQFGVTGLSATPFAWGWSTITPQAMAQLLTLLLTGQVLTPQDRALALNLMENVESDQQIGVGTTAPAGATVALKDGWVQGPDDLWVMNTSGIVYSGSETYIISVYTTDLDDLPQGWDITQHVCGAVAQLLG
jgi:hypothetical protein